MWRVGFVSQKQSTGIPFIEITSTNMSIWYTPMSCRKNWRKSWSQKYIPNVIAVFTNDIIDFILLLTFDKLNADIPPKQQLQPEGHSARESQKHKGKCIYVEKIQYEQTKCLTNKNRREACWLCVNVHPNNYWDEERNREEEIEVQS